MAHWAEINENNIVLRVTVGDNNEPDEGYQWLIDNIGGRWIQTSYNGNFRVRYAGIGYTYDKIRDAFIPPKPFFSWSLSEKTINWEPPIEKPIEGNWDWDEETTSWKELL